MTASCDGQPPVPEKKNMEEQEKKHFRRVILRRTMSYTGIGLVTAALVGGLYGDRLHFTWALCAAGGLFLAWGWFTYLASDPSSVLSRWKMKRKNKTEVPYALRRGEAKKHPAKPAFLRGNEDFDDDLAARTAVDWEILSGKEKTKALIASRIAAAALLFLISLF